MNTSVLAHWESRSRKHWLTLLKDAEFGWQMDDANDRLESWVSLDHRFE